jgi:aryl-alcohol dehydrogenase-like predicted oxidoreductase
MAPKLPTRELGRGGPQVVALGMSVISLRGGAGLSGSDYERFAFLDRAYELGETNWDSENLEDSYDASTESVIGRWFKRTGRRNEIFLATKIGFMEMINPTKFRTAAEMVFASCELSLKRLQTDWIDLFYCHRVDGKTPIEKTVQAMAELKK